MSTNTDRAQLKLFSQPINVTQPSPLDLDTLNPGSIWQHHTGRAYTILMVTNTASTDAARFPATVVYKDMKNNHWSKSVPRFLASMKRVEAQELLTAVMAIGEEVFDACGRRYSPSRIRAYYLKNNFDRVAVVKMLVGRGSDR